MNAIILAAGKSSRMYKSGANRPKGILPILGIPNIERTILMLHLIDVYEIIIAVPFESIHFDYLAEKYSCTIIHIPSVNKNTLTTLNYLLEYIGNSFIIEGDVVCSKNIFKTFKHSTYYVMNYRHPECDEWNITTDSENNILNFEIGTHLTPAIFGISFWIEKDCFILKDYLRAQLQNEHATEENFFWDDNISELLGHICLKSYEIDSDTACEMNTVSEYQYAINLCREMIIFPNKYFNDSYIRTSNTNLRICGSKDKEHNLEWLNKLLTYYNDHINNNMPNLYDYWFHSNESAFVVKDNNKEIAFFSFVAEKKFILLRRLFVDSSYRARGIGKKIVSYIQLFAISCNKELRVNVYNEAATEFYVNLGAEKLFSTYYWKLEGDRNE